MLYNSVSDEAKENSDLFATLYKIRTMNPMVPGVYVDLSQNTSGTMTVHLKNRIPLSSFLTNIVVRFVTKHAPKIALKNASQDAIVDVLINVTNVVLDADV